MSYISSRLAVIKPPASMAVSQAAKALRATGVDVIDLGLGEPDFPTRPHIIEATYAAAKSGETPYTASSGAPAVRQDDLTLSPPEGAFYAFIGCGSLIGRHTPDGQILENDTMGADYLLKAGRVASVPGVAYGLSPYFRISTATSDTILGEAIARIAAAVAQTE